MLPGHWDTYSTCSHVEHCVYQLSLFAQSPLPHPHPQDCPQSSNQRVNAWHSRGLVCPRVSHQPCKVLDTIPYWLDAPQGGPAGQVPLASCIWLRAPSMLSSASQELGGQGEPLLALQPHFLPPHNPSHIREKRTRIKRADPGWGGTAWAQLLA